MGNEFSPCSIEGCARNAHHTAHGAKGMCSAHYQRVRIHGDASMYKRSGPKAPRFKCCSVPVCDRNAVRSAAGKAGFCSMHYARWKKHGDPLRVATPPSPAKDWIAQHSTYEGDDCLLWPFHVGSDGYGRVHRFGNGPLTTASNLMCEVAHGPAPTLRHECAHSCGKGHEACVNPRHLYWATPAQNQADRVSHGTTNRGERHGAHKLTEDDVRAIRRLDGVMTQTEIANIYDIDPAHVSDIVNRKDWSWLD